MLGGARLVGRIGAWDVGFLEMQTRKQGATPTENFEGLAVVPGQRGGVVLWLISDDNQSAFQRTLLLKLLWRPNEKARETIRAPS